jgi:hypothetical protein
MTTRVRAGTGLGGAERVRADLHERGDAASRGTDSSTGTEARRDVLHRMQRRTRGEGEDGAGGCSGALGQTRAIAERQVFPLADAGPESGVPA